MPGKDYNQLNQPILQALKDVKILEEKKIKYLVMGSLICAAARGRFYRHVEDVDLICDLKDKYRIKKIFEKMGYIAKFEKPKYRLGFYWLDLKYKKNKRRFIAVVFGNFDKKGGWTLPLNKGFCMFIPSSGMKPTKYSLRGINFIGFPMEPAFIALTTLPLLYNNPKRKKDLESIKDKVSKEIVNQIYEEKVGMWWRNIYLPNWAILKTLAFFKNLILGKDYPV